MLRGASSIEIPCEDKKAPRLRRDDNGVLDLDSEGRGLHPNGYSPTSDGLGRQSGTSLAEKVRVLLLDKIEKTAPGTVLSAEAPTFVAILDGKPVVMGVEASIHIRMTNGGYRHFDGAYYKSSLNLFDLSTEWQLSQENLKSLGIKLVTEQGFIKRIIVTSEWRVGVREEGEYDTRDSKGVEVMSRHGELEVTAEEIGALYEGETAERRRKRISSATKPKTDGVVFMGFPGDGVPGITVSAPLLECRHTTWRAFNESLAKVSFQPNPQACKNLKRRFLM